MLNDRKMNRRTTLKLAGAGAAAVVAARAGGPTALAQSDAGALGALGLPELTITISDTGYEGLDSQLDAGMYLVTAENSGSGPGFIEFMQLPEGMTVADLTALLAGGGDSTPVAAGDTASPAAGEGGDQGPPEWYYSTYLAGGAGVNPGETARFAINLTAGTYVVWGEDPSAPQQPAELTVTGDAASPTATDAGQADVTIEEVTAGDGFAFQLTGDFAEGSQVIAVTNTTTQPHFVEIDRLPDGTTREEVDALFQSFMTGTPVAGGLTEQDIQSSYFVGTQSAGTTQWHELSLDAGVYLVACFVGDIARGGIPHAFEGMYDVITIEGGAGATPTS